MNNEIEKVALELNQMILQSKEYQRFHNYEAAIKKCSELEQIEKTLKKMQKQIVNASFHQSEELDSLKEQYQNLMDEFKNHPLVNNYIIELESLNEFLQYINHYINGALK